MDSNKAGLGRNQARFVWPEQMPEVLPVAAGQ